MSKAAGCIGQRGEGNGTTGTMGCSRELAPLRAGQGICSSGLQQQPLALLFVLC